MRPTLLDEVLIPVSPGELLDKITILELKSERIVESQKLVNVRCELDRLREVWRQTSIVSEALDELTSDLKSVNGRLWCIEDEIRYCEKDRDFGPRFIALARAVYHENDHRSQTKRAINELLGAQLIEEKQYCRYEEETATVSSNV